MILARFKERTSTIILEIIRRWLCDGMEKIVCTLMICDFWWNYKKIKFIFLLTCGTIKGYTNPYTIDEIYLKYRYLYGYGRAGWKVADSERPTDM